jgi:adenosylcobinamide kinase/adenosylcobinamide-phosphate guanylyltransferase
MSTVVLTGAVRSGKSAAAEALALAHGGDVVVAVAGWDGDGEMVRRIDAHRAVRPTHWAVHEVGAVPDWVAVVDPGAVLVLDCIATLIGAIAWETAGEAEIATGEQEALGAQRTEALVDALLARAGDTIIVTNEAGWGVVPATAAGRLFRDLLGRANRALVDGADAAYLVVAGRVLDLHALPAAPEWPAT